MRSWDFDLSKRCDKVRPVPGLILEKFSCGNEEIDSFFHHDAFLYENEMMSRTYSFIDRMNGNRIVSMFSLSNDSIKTNILTNPVRNKLQRNIPNPALIVCVGIINAYNFMDGINGITGAYSLAVLIPLAVLNVRYSFVDPALIFVTALSVLVFCFFNFRKRARCFAGDVGSVGIAFIILFILGRLIAATGDVQYLLLLGVYGIDTVLTIIHRILLHEHLGEAHRKHAYQLMANELHIPHTSVSFFYFALQLIVSGGLLAVPDSLQWPYTVAVLMILALAYLLFMRKYYHLHAEYLNSLKS